MLRGIRNRLFGDDGERLAARHLKRRGLKILKRQWRGRFGEIDIVARDRSTIVFVEVKTRRSTARGRPEEAVNRTKQRQITRAAHEWIKRFGQPGWSYRFDVIAVVLPEGQPAEIKHIEHAFEAVD